jgi:hypothetical protein
VFQHVRSLELNGIAFRNPSIRNYAYMDIRPFHGHTALEILYFDTVVSLKLNHISHMQRSILHNMHGVSYGDGILN